MLTASLPKSFWGDCILIAIHLIDLLPVQQLKFKCPYELLYNKSPDYTSLRIFGCLCYTADVSSAADKFNPRGLKCIFLGYPFGKKDYRVMHLESKKCYTSRDVIFVENVFPFHTIQTDSSDLLFPTESSDNNHLFQCHTEFNLDLASLESSDSTTNITVSSDSNVVPITDNTSVDNSHLNKLIRPSRTKTIPSKFKDYTGLPELVSKNSSIMNLCVHPLHKYVSYHIFKQPHVAFLANITATHVPYTYKQAVVHKHWSDAMVYEITTLEENKTWNIVPRPPNKNVVDCKWLFKVKYTPEGTVDKYKARLVPKGFTQTIGVDYFETYAPVAKMTTVRVVLALAAKYNWHIHQMDVNNAFLHGVLTEEIYMKLPPGFQYLSSTSHTFSPGVELVCRLRKSIYFPKKKLVSQKNSFKIVKCQPR